MLLQTLWCSPLIVVRKEFFLKDYAAAQLVHINWETVKDRTYWVADVSTHVQDSPDHVYWYKVWSNLFSCTTNSSSCTYATIQSPCIPVFLRGEQHTAPRFVPHPFFHSKLSSPHYTPITIDRRVMIHCHLLQSSRCVGSSGRKKERAPMSQEMLDLLQVDLLASGACLAWPRDGRPRATKSRVRPAPYEIRRRTFLKV